MKKIKITKWLSIIVALCGIIVILGWVFDIAILKSILPMWVTMKFSTAVSFFMSGIALYFIAKEIEGKSAFAQVVLPAATLIISLLMFTLLVSNLIGIRTGVEDLFIKERLDSIKTVTPGRPSVGTMINFILIAMASIFTMLGSEGLKFKLLIIGCIISFIGSLPLIGYMINKPILYYSVRDISTAMAFHTAILFTIIGIGFILLGKTRKKE